MSNIHRIFRTGLRRCARALLCIGLLQGAGAAQANDAPPARPHLSAAQRDWLVQHPVVSVGVNSFPPLIFSASDGSPTGIGPEYAALIAERLGIQLKWVSFPTWGAEIDALRDGSLDVAPTMVNADTPPGLIAGKPWMYLKGVIVTRRDAPPVMGIGDFAHQTIAVQRITPGEMEIGRRFPQQKLLVAESVPEMLDAVVTGRAAAGVSMLAVVDYAMRNDGYGDSLTIAAPFGEQEVPVRMLANGQAKMLVSILDAGIASVSDAERQQILQHWFRSDLDDDLPSWRVLRWALTIALPAIAGLAFVLYWVFRLRREVRWRKTAQARAQRQAEQLTQAKAELDQALQRTSGQFQAILDNAPMAIWAKGLDGRYLMANNGYREMFAIGDHAIVGERDDAFFSDETAASFRRKDEITIRDKSTRSFIEASVRRDGTRQSLLIVKFPLFDDQGKVYATAGITANVSEQIALQDEMRRLNQALAQREQQLLLISNSPVVDAGDVLETLRLVTQAACAGLGVQRASVWFWDTDHEAIVCRALLDTERGFSEEPTRLARIDFPRYFAALADGRAVLANDANRDTRTAEFSRPYLRPLGITSMLDVAIRHGGRIVGVLCCEHTGAAREWREEEGFFASALSDLIGRALTAESRVRAEAELKDLLATLEHRVAERSLEAQEQREVAETARRRIADITDSVPGVVFEFLRAADGHYSAHFVSGGMRELAGLSAEAVMEDVSCYFAQVLPEDLPEYLAQIERSAAEVAEHRHSFRLRHAATGELRWMSVHALPRRHTDGGTEWCGYVSDISVQKRMEQALEQALEKTEAAKQAKGEFLANMSHEIRTPMNAIIGMSHLVLQTELAPRQLNYVTKIDSAARSLLGIINDVLDFSKIEAGKLLLESAEFSLQGLFDSLTALIGHKTQQKGLELLFDIDPSIPDALIGDTGRLNQVLVNLCSNAVKFTEHGEIVVSVSPLERAEDSVKIRFAVRDSGIGLAPEQIDHLFQPFEQADASTTRKYGGTGLGLSIAKRLCEMMGGEINVSSEPGKGSTFWFTSRLQPSQKTPPTVPADIEGLRALIVDDNASARKILLSLAGSLKLHAMAVSSAEEARAALATAIPPFDIVFCDWEMPGLSSKELARTIKLEMRLPHAPAAVLLAPYGSEDLLRDSGIHSGETVLTKPASASSMLESILRALGRNGEGPAARAAQAIRPAAAPDLHGLCILLVEDNDVNREVAEEILAQTGARITLADNGREALAALKQASFDLVLMDIQMPVMDGEEATRILRGDPALSTLPIIAMTASAMVGDRERFLAKGMNDHIVKPIDVSAFYAMLERWLRPKPAMPMAAGESQTAAEPRALPESGALAVIPPIEGIDETRGLMHTGHNAELYLRVLRKFRDSQGDAMARIRAALGRDDFDTAMREAHSLAGSAGTIGATNVFRAAQAVEAACRSRSTVEVGKLWDLDKALTIVIESLSASLDRAQASAKAVAIPGAHEDSRIPALLQELKRELAEYDVAAGDTLDLLRGILGYDSRVEQIGRHLSRYDFASAARFAETLGQAPGKDIETAVIRSE